MKGYKAFDKNLKCRRMQFEVGKTYTMEEDPIICERGFHFCKTIADCYKYYPVNSYTRICEVEATGKIVTDKNKDKYSTNSITIIAEVKDPMIRSNSNASNTGVGNVGICNTGFFNKGKCNSGNHNKGNYNVGYYNKGYGNAGSYNNGDNNTGSYNNGEKNTGQENYGFFNAGNYNFGSYNSGNSNTGNYNTGNCNSGSWNTGCLNSGRWNTGDANLGNFNTGCFCTEEDPTIKFFDKESDWTMRDYLLSWQRIIIEKCPQTRLEFVYTGEMTTTEKRHNKDYKTNLGYLKKITVTAEDKLKWWENLSDYERELIYQLPNFDMEKFCACIGIPYEKVPKKYKPDNYFKSLDENTYLDDCGRKRDKKTGRFTK